MHIMWKVPSSNKMAANYFVPPVNLYVLQNCKTSEKSKQANQPSRKPPSTALHIYFVCLCTTVFFFALLNMQHTEKQQEQG